MISLRKLASLPSGTRIRKLIYLIDQWEHTLDTLPPQIPTIVQYLSTVTSRDFSSLERLTHYNRSVQEMGTLFEGSEPLDQQLLLPRLLHRIRFFLQEEIGAEPAEWDFRTLEGNPANRYGSSPRNVLPIRLYLDEIRSPYNVGSIFRTAECFGVERILLAPGTASPTHPRARRSAMGSMGIVPWEVAPYSQLEEEPNLFALETGGEALEHFPFPSQGICIVGSEELGVHPRLLSLAKKKRGIVSIPLYGSKTSLNVSVAVGILMQHWARQLSHR